jgi:AcrR family transcriptional regulator
MVPLPQIVNNAPWFGALVIRRRDSLGMRPNQVAYAGGPAVPTTLKIEAGRGTTTVGTLARLDHALRWDTGSSARALRAGEHSDAARGLRSDAARGLRSTVDEAAMDGGAPAGIAPVGVVTTVGRRSRTGERVDLQERAKRTRRKILHAVARTIARHGAAGSINDIVHGGGVTKGALYFHFDSRDDVISGMLEEAAAIATFPGDTTAGDAVQDDSGADAASAIVAAYITRAQEIPLLRAEAVLWQAPDHLETARSGTYRILRTALVDAFAAAGRTDAADAADAVMAVLAGDGDESGEGHGLADPTVADTAQRLIAPIVHRP